MRSQPRKSFAYGGAKLNDSAIQDAYSTAKNTSQVLPVLENIFETIHLAHQDRQYPGRDSAQIIKNLNSKMMYNIEARKPEPFIDPKATYPLNKSGALGILLRQCSISEDGILEKQGNKPFVLKEVAGFKNAIQTEKGKNNEKLQWVKDNKKYPFRIIVRDKKNAAKAIYFKTYTEANKIRVFYASKFLYKKNLVKELQQCARKVTERTADQLKSKLLEFKGGRKSSSKLNKGILDESNHKRQEGDSAAEGNNLPGSDMLNRNTNNKSNRGFDTDLIKLLEDKDKSRVSGSKGKSIGAEKLNQFQRAATRHLFLTWAAIAKDLDDNRGIEDVEESIRGINTFSSQPKPKMGVGVINKAQPEPRKAKPDIISYKSVQLLNETSLFIKPIVVISLTRNGSVEQESKFNTIILRRQPHLSYELVISSGEQSHELASSIKDYEIRIRAVDYLTNAQLCNEVIELKSKAISSHTFVMNEQKSIRLEMKYQGPNAPLAGARLDDSPEGCLLEVKPLSGRVIEEIRSFWEQEISRKTYYNLSKDIKIIEIFSLYELPPKFWVLGLSESDYTVVNLLHSASKILKFKLTQSIIPIVRVVQKLYSSLEELVEVLLSIILNYMGPYYQPSQFCRVNKLHMLLGLEGDMELSSKVGLEMEIIKRIVGIECPQFEEKMRRRGIGYVHLLYQNIYEIFSANFALKTLVEIWNFLFRDPAMLPVYMVLLAVWLVKFYSQKLCYCFKFSQIEEILNSKQFVTADMAIRDVIVLREKYFPSQDTTNLIESIKGMFNIKPLQQVVVEFYKRETERLDRRKENRSLEKNLILGKLSQELPLELPKYPARTYCLHIYFYQLPPVPGSLYIKANGIEYECLNLPRVRYFIIGEVGTEVHLEFINNKSSEFSCRLLCMQGVNRYTVELASVKDSQVYQVEYLCGLLTEGHTEVLKKNRRFQHYIGAFAKQDEVFDQFMRPTQDCSFLNGHAKRLEKDDLGKKIKVVFSSGSKCFNQFEFYLRWISCSPLTLPEKLDLVRRYALSVSQEFFLCQYKELQKVFLSMFLSITEFHISAQELKSYYCDSMEGEFSGPRIIKCRLVLPNGSEFKLEEPALDYLANKLKTHLHEDIIINDLVVALQKKIEPNLIHINEATLNLIYSSYGEVRNLEIPLVRKKSSRELLMDDTKYELDTSENNDISTVEPEVLVSEIMPTFAKISTILDFVNNSKSIDSLHRNREPRRVPECINLLRNCDAKFGKVILMRYRHHPEHLRIPFLGYYHELTCQPVEPVLPRNYYLNNLQTDLKEICVYPGRLTFSDSRRTDNVLLSKPLGLYGNLRALQPKTDTLYFFSVGDSESKVMNGDLFVNYGYGLFRWEPCRILGFNFASRGREGSKKEKQAVKMYLVRYNNSEALYAESQVRVRSEHQAEIRRLEMKPSSSRGSKAQRRPGEMTNSRQQMSRVSQRSL